VRQGGKFQQTCADLHELMKNIPLSVLFSKQTIQKINEQTSCKSGITFYPGNNGTDCFCHLGLE
jgi:hypothetical protein